MDEKEIFNLIQNMDSKLFDEEFDEFLKDKDFDINRIKDKTMDKIDAKSKSRRSYKKIAAITIAAALSVSTVYADEISEGLKSIFNKSVVYDTVVDGAAFYLPNEMKLNDDFTLENVSMSSDYLDITLLPMDKISDEDFENLNVKITPLDDESVYYTVGGYGYDGNSAITVSFMNGTLSNYNINPVDKFILSIGNSDFEIALKESEKIESNELLFASTSPNSQSIVDIVGKDEGNGNIQLITGFDIDNLKLAAYGDFTSDTFTKNFENNNNEIFSSSTGLNTEPLIGYDSNNNPYTLNIPDNAVGRPITNFVVDTNEKLKIEIPSIVVNLDKEIDTINLPIPLDGKTEINKEIDYGIQSLVIKSIERINENTGVIDFELNTGDNKNISIIDLGAYSDNLISGSTITKDNNGKMTITFNENNDNFDLTFSNPSFSISDDWIVDLN